MKKIKPLFWVYAFSLLLTLHIAVPLFINSTFLSTFASDEIVGLIYSIGSLLTIISLLAVSKALEKFGNYKITLTLLFVEILALLGLALWENHIFIIMAFMVHFILSTVIAFNTDIFAEKYSSDKNTGEIRGLWYSLLNIAWLLAPLIAGFLIGDTENYWLVYIVAVMFLVPALFMLKNTMSNFRDAKYHKLSFYKDFWDVIRDKDERYIFLSGLMLRLFFAWMVIYTPIYLNQHIGFNFKEIGFIFSLMMLAYILFEWPIGILADRKLGEKELLTTGFIVVAISTAFLSFVTSANLITWIILMFLTRTGAALMEVTTESYFFKKISSKDTDDISFWRMSRPMAYLIAPLLASPFLWFFEFRYIFLAIGIIMFAGSIFPLQIKDTR